MVFRGRTDHRRAADIDILDAILKRRARAPRSPRTGIGSPPRGRSARCYAPAICAYARAGRAGPECRHGLCGTSVFTRPSRISGKPVWSETSFTATPASRSALAEPPVERISTPCIASARANRHHSGLVGDGNQSTADGNDISHRGSFLSRGSRNGRDGICRRAVIILVLINSRPGFALGIHHTGEDKMLEQERRGNRPDLLLCGRSDGMVTGPCATH